MSELWIDEAGNNRCKTSLFLEEALSCLIRNKTVMVIAHRMRTVSGADKIVVLSDGTIAEDGSPKDLLTQKDSTFHRMSQLQTASAEWSI